jgi:hypothetical protein
MWKWLIYLKEEVITLFYSVDNILVKKINFLREKLEYLLKENCGKVTEEVLSTSEKLDKLLVTYYKENYI